MRFLILSLILFLPLYCQTVIRELDEIRNKVDSAKIVILDNGVKIVWIEEKFAPTFASIVAVRVGSVDEPKGKKGISHFFEHLAFKGTKTVGTLDFNRESDILKRVWQLESKLLNNKISDQGKNELKILRKELSKISQPERFMAELANLGGIDINAFTSSDATMYLGRFPSESLSQWINLEVDRLINPVPRQFFEEMRVIFQERSMSIENNPVGKMYEKLLWLGFKNHPYRYPIIGYKEDLLKLIPQDIIEFHKSHYFGSNIVFVLIGDVDEDKVVQVLKPQILRIPDGSRNDVEIKSTKRLGELVVLKKNFGTRAIMVGFKKGVYPDFDDVCGSLVARILFDEKFGKLRRMLIEDDNIFTSVSFGEAPGYRYPNMFFAFLPFFQNVDLNKAIRKFLSFIEGFELTQEDIEKVKKLIVADLSKVFENRLDLGQFLAELTLLYGSPKEFINILDKMMKLEIDDVQKCGRDIFNKNNLIILASEK